MRTHACMQCYLNEPLKHVCKGQERNKNVFLIWRYDFLHDRQLLQLNRVTKNEIRLYITKANVNIIKTTIYQACVSLTLTSVAFRKPEKSATMFPCVSMTPFGFPKENKHTDILKGDLMNCAKLCQCPENSSLGLVHLMAYFYSFALHNSE